jgi:hypothetical protein
MSGDSLPKRQPRIIPNGEDQQYLFAKYSIPIRSERQKVEWVKQGLYPRAFPISPGRLGRTDIQLDQHAQRVLARAAEASK